MGYRTAMIVGVYLGSELLTGIPANIISLGIELRPESVVIVHKRDGSTAVGLLVGWGGSQVKLTLSLNQTSDCIAKSKVKGACSVLDCISPSVQVTSSANPLTDCKHLAPLA